MPLITITNIILYIAFAAILYFIIKGFTGRCLSNIKIVIMIILILILMIFICNSNMVCSNGTTEGFNTISSNPLSVPSPQNLVNEFGIDQNKYSQIIRNEDEAKKRIRCTYQNEMIGTETNPLNTVPLGAALYDYTYLPPENWFRAYEKPPVCITDNPAKIRPMTSSTIYGLMEFETSDHQD